MNGKTLLERGPISLMAYTTPTPDIIAQLENTSYGTEGLAYRHMNVREKVPLLPSPYFLTLRKRKQLAGTMALSRRDSTLEDSNFRAYYIRYFSFLESMRRPNQQLENRKPSRAGNRLIRPLIWSLFDRTDPVEVDISPAPTLYYAYVEAENQRSYEMCQSFGFKPIRTMTTLPFSRTYPKKHMSVRKAKPEEYARLLESVKTYYTDYSLTSFETAFAGDHYWVWEEKGEIIGGVQAYPITWKFDSLPGFSGWATMNLVPYLPILGRLFNPKNYRFAAFEALWHQPGREDIILPMLESTLALSSLTVGMHFVDKHGPLYATLKSLGNFGLMYRLNGEVDSEIIARFANTTDEETRLFAEKPAYISAFDCT